ncbi:putative disease resistance protein RGA1 [Ziziphus jujuba]|uniref:Disease resistance protein RGA1 n=1 Tax=Ziziphus jujuba TaxID=326968 RepID=A0ABM4A2E5_ZIZJJ|nr:putative disease resistance protein RGA1 [Ziziphus jujuba]
MAEGVVSNVVSSIILKVGSQAFKEIGKFWGLKEEFEKLGKTMEVLVAAILDAEEKRVSNNLVKVWLGRLEDAVGDIDNLLDEFQTEALGRQLMSGNRMTKKVRVFFSNSNQIAFRLKMVRKLEKIKETLKDIKEDSTLEVIGRDDDKMKIVELLLGCGSDQDKDNVSLLPIVRIGGLGKTTLAQLVFNHKMVEKHFEPQIWVCISDAFDLKIILEKMFKSVDGSVQQGLELDQLQKSLRKKLSGKRYLLVLDDMWNEDREK